MPKQVIVLERLSQNPLRFRYALWAAVPAARQAMFADPTRTSAFKTASAQELQHLKDGKIVERIDEIEVQPPATIAQIQAQLEAAWAAFQAEINGNGPTANPWNRYGTFWDGAAWTAQGVS